MPGGLTPETIAAYERDGAVLLTQPFESHWVDGLRAEVDRILDRHDRGEPNHCFVTSSSGRAHINNMVLKEPFSRRWAVESPVGEIVARLIGSSTARFYLDVVFCKQGAGTEGRTVPHHDVAAFGFKGHHLPSFWMALTDVGEDNAPLCTALGSHKRITHMFRSVASRAELPVIAGYKPHEDVARFLDEHNFPTRVWTARKGDVVVVNPYCIHWSMPMLSSERRIGFSTRWIGDDVRWQPNIYHEVEASTHPATLDAGSPPPDDWFPKVWDAGEGFVARASGAFTKFVTVEPRPGYHKLS